jgi:hypothetical protein
LKIETIPIKVINPAKYNPRKDLQPGDPEYEKLKKSILTFEMVEPLVWNKRTGNLVGGHQRLKILKELGHTDVDVSVVDLSDSKEKALNLALNKIQGEWDLPKLKDLLQELDTGEFDLGVTGFGEDEIENLMTQYHVVTEGKTDDDAIPKKVKIICRPGDLWQLGTHRLLCGDAVKVEDLQKLMGGHKIDHEPVYYCGPGSVPTGKNSRWYGPNNEVTTWEISKDDGRDYLHPTQKPVALAARAIHNSSALNQIVVDLFGGSGSTMIACEKLGRWCFMMEIDPHYCDIIIERWQKFTGKKAERINDGARSKAKTDRNKKARGQSRKAPPARAHQGK